MHTINLVEFVRPHFTMPRVPWRNIGNILNWLLYILQILRFENEDDLTPTPNEDIHDLNSSPSIKYSFEKGDFIPNKNYKCTNNSTNFY